MIGTASLILAGVGALGGAIGGAANRRKARETSSAYYDYATDFADAQAHSTIMDTAGGKALLKLSKQNAADNLEGIENRMAAGGATMENRLAARQANNESLDKVNMNLLQADEKNRRMWEDRKFALAGQEAKDMANSYLQAAQDWQSWGSAMGNAALAFGSTGLLGGASGAAEAASNAMRSGADYANLISGGLAPLTTPNTVRTAPVSGLKMKSSLSR